MVCRRPDQSQEILAGEGFDEISRQQGLRGPAFLWALAGSCQGAVDYDQLFCQSSDLMAQGDLDGAMTLLWQAPTPAPAEEAGAFVSSRMQAARILASRSKMMLFDEPTSALDPELVPFLCI